MLRLFALAIAGLVAACASDAVVDCVDDCVVAADASVPLVSPFQPWAEGFQGDLRFVEGDSVTISLPFYDDEDDVEAVVTADGNIYVALLGAVPAAGKTAAELENELEQRFARFLRFPEVGLVPTDFASRQVYVGGEVGTPGVYPLTGPVGALEAVFQAGGFLNTAHRESVVLIRRGPNNLPMMKFLNLRSFSNQGTPTENTILQPFDIIHVPKSSIASVNLFVQQYIDGIVPFNHSFNYDILQIQ